MFNFKKTILTISASLLTFSMLVPPAGFASDLEETFIETNEVEETYSVLGEESTEKIVILETKYFVKHPETGELVPQDTVGTGEYKPMNSLDPGTGAIRVTTYAMGGGTTVFSQEKSGIYEQISGVAMYLLGKYAGSVGTLISDLVSASSYSLNKKSYVTAQTFYSYRYPGKYGQVYLSSKTWSTKAESRSRETFKHSWGRWVDNNGYTRTNSFDYIRANGYGPHNIEYAPHYTNNTWIANKAYDVWYWGRIKYYENWAS